MMKLFKHLNVLSITALMVLLFSLQASAQIKVLDKIVAIVDDDVVLQSELDQRIDSIVAQLTQSGTQMPPKAILEKQVLDRLISERLQLTMGYDSGVRISDEELNQGIARIAASNKISVAQYIEQVNLQGSSISSMRGEIRNELTIMRVQQGKVMRRIRISEQELDNFLKSEEGRFVTSPDVNIGQILLSISSDATKASIDQIVGRADLLFNQIEQGADFRSAAIANSADQSALQGGDLGWRKMAQLPGVFIEAVEKLELGEVIAYDSLWELHHLEDMQHCVDCLLTIGSPLGMNYVQRRLIGQHDKQAPDYPGNVRSWVNISARGDLVALDPTLANDFGKMIEKNLLESITDHRAGIYNHYRDEKGLNVHKSYGYLVNPVVARTITDWWTNA